MSAPELRAQGRPAARPSLVGVVDRLDGLLRHRSVLGEHRWLRNLLRKPYHRLLNRLGRGSALHLGGQIPIRVPAEFSSREMEHYEPEAVRALVAWCRDNDHGVVIDIGCSVGYISCAALFSNPTVECLAIDADINSLQAAGRVCQYAAGSRLQRICALVSDASSAAAPSLAAAREQTEAMFAQARVSGDPYTTMYVCLDPGKQSPVPTYRLDDLIAPGVFFGRPCLVKCDVEGAEWMVLNGARRLLDNFSPALLLSIHPQYLPKYGRAKEEIRALLEQTGYAVAVLATDHEEHWWCQKPAGPAAPHPAGAP